MNNHILSNADLAILPAGLVSFASGMNIISSSSGSNEHFEIQHTANLVNTSYSAQFKWVAGS